MSRQSARNAAASSAVTLRPSNQTSPAVGSISRRMQRPVVDLPEPDSPTSPSVSPGADLEADVVDRVHASRRCAPRKPPPIAKFLIRSLTRSSGSVIARPSPVRPATSTQATLWPPPTSTQRRHRLAAFRHGVAAARREAAAGRRVEQARHHARDRLEPRLVRRGRVDARDRADQALRVGMARIGEQLRRPALPRSPCRHTSRRRAAPSRPPRPSRG